MSDLMLEAYVFNFRETTFDMQDRPIREIGIDEENWFKVGHTDQW
jgi:hypothetical protein